MKPAIAVIIALVPSMASAGWATGECVTQYGNKINYMISNGHGYVSYNGREPEVAFSEKKNNLGIINYIGSSRSMRMAIDLDTGRGYIVTRLDNGEVVEGNIKCKLGYRE
jgi:hypothetical protein